MRARNKAATHKRPMATLWFEIVQVDNDAVLVASKFARHA